MGVVEVPGFLVIATVLALTRGGCGTNVDLQILEDNNDTYGVLDTFSYDKPFTRTSASVPPDGLRGYVNYLGDATSVEAVPNATETWVALVSSTPEELLGQLDRVRAAGYSMMLAYARYSTNDSNSSSGLTITLEVMDSLFPVVFVEQDAAGFIIYATFAIESVVVVVSVGAASDYAIVLTTTSLALVAASIFVLYRCGKRCNILCCCNNADHYDVQEAGAAPWLAAPAPAQYDPYNQNGNEYGLQSAREYASGIPVEKYEAKKYNEPICPVCMGDFSPGDEVKVLPCHHNFHPECIDTWLTSKCICPMCRQDPRDLNRAVPEV